MTIYGQKISLANLEATGQKIARHGQCTKLVKAQPKVGDIERHPPPKQCSRPVYKDGFCKTHNVEYQENQKAIHQDAVDRHQDSLNKFDPVAHGIKTLIDMGYTISKNVVAK